MFTTSVPVRLQQFNSVSLFICLLQCFRGCASCRGFSLPQSQASEQFAPIKVAWTVELSYFHRCTTMYTTFFSSQEAEREMHIKRICPHHGDMLAWAARPRGLGKLQQVRITIVS